MQCKTEQVLEKMRTTIRRHELFEKGDAVLVAVSGGADSICLLHALKQLQEELNIRIAAAHIHHGIRGAEAERDAKFVSALCRQWKIPFYLEKVSVPTLAEEEMISLETAGRLLRYRSLHSLCERKGFQKIATAHNQNDQAETVLMRVFRGAGIDGLAGIRYFRHDGVVRPLLDVSRKEIEEYCGENQISYCTDSTNLENDYTRNRIRNTILPLLGEQLNPNVVGAISALAQNMAEDSDFLNEYAKRLYARLGSPLPKRRPVVLDIDSLKLLSPSLCVRLFRLAAEEAMGKKYHAERKHWEAVRELLDKETGAATVLPSALTVTVRYGWLAFETPQDLQKGVGKGFSYPVEPGADYEMENGMVSVSFEEPDLVLQGNQMMLDFEKLQGRRMELRTRKKGDWIAIYQDGRKKKLKDFLIDCKIPHQEREGIPLLCSGQEVLAVVGYRVAEPYKTDRNTKRGLVVTYETKDENW